MAFGIESGWSDYVWSVTAGQQAPETVDRRLESLAFWMRTSGAVLLGVQRFSSIRLRTAAHDGRRAHGLLYLAAVRDGWSAAVLACP